MEPYISFGIMARVTLKTKLEVNWNPNDDCGEIEYAQLEVE